MVELFVGGMERVAGYMRDEEEKRFLQANKDWVEKCKELWGMWRSNVETEHMKLETRLSLFLSLFGEDYVYAIFDEEEDEDEIRPQRSFRGMLGRHEGLRQCLLCSAEAWGLIVLHA
jgi:hypothetical protein